MGLSKAFEGRAAEASEFTRVFASNECYVTILAGNIDECGRVTKFSKVVKLFFFCGRVTWILNNTSTYFTRMNHSQNLSKTCTCFRTTSASTTDRELIDNHISARPGNHPTQIRMCSCQNGNITSTSNVRGLALRVGVRQYL